MDNDLFDYLTFRNIVLLVFCLPLVTMLITMPFLSLIPRSIKEWIDVSGIFGFIANCIVVVELGLRTIAGIIAHFVQKPKVFSEIVNGKFTIVSRYELFDFFFLKYFIVFLIIATATWVVLDIYSTKRKFGRSGKPYSEKNPLNLNE